MPHDIDPALGISRRRVLQGAAWTAPAIVLATAVPARAAASGVTTTTIAVSTAHDYRTGQTPGVAPTNADGTGGAQRAGNNSLYIVLRITNTGTIPLKPGFVVAFDAKNSETIARGSLLASLSSLWTGSPASGTQAAQIVSYTYVGPDIPVGGHVDLVGSLGSVAGSTDLPITVTVGGSNTAAPVSGLYGAPLLTGLVVLEFQLKTRLPELVTTSTYSGSNGSSFTQNPALRTAYPAYYENHDL